MMRSRVGRSALVATMLSVIAVGTSAQAAPVNPVLAIGNYAVAIADHQHPARVVTAQDVSDAMVASHSSDFSGANLRLGFNLGNTPGFLDTIEVTNMVTYKQVCLRFPQVVGGPPRLVACSPKAILIWQSSLPLDAAALALVAKEANNGRAVSGADVVSARMGHLAVKPTFRAGQGGIAKFKFSATFSSKRTTVSICVRFSKWAYVSPLLESCP